MHDEEERRSEPTQVVYEAIMQETQEIEEKEPVPTEAVYESISEESLVLEEVMEPE